MRAYCAVDALGIPAMLDQDATIGSHDPLTGVPITVAVRDGQARWEPAGVVVGYVIDHQEAAARDGPAGQAACSRCPLINFHVSPAAAQAWQQRRGPASGAAHGPAGPAAWRRGVRRAAALQGPSRPGSARHCGHSARDDRGAPRPAHTLIPQRSICMPISIDLGRLQGLRGRGAQLVEVLPPAEYAEEHLPGAINIPLKQLDATTAARLDPDRPVIVYCWDAL